VLYLLIAVLLINNSYCYSLSLPEVSKANKVVPRIGPRVYNLCKNRQNLGDKKDITKKHTHMHCCSSASGFLEHIWDRQQNGFLSGNNKKRWDVL